MQKITPFLWFNDNAEEAVALYTSVFKDSKIISTMRYGDAGPAPKGSIMTVSFLLEGQAFTALNGGPIYTHTPATSLFVQCASREDIDAIWARLSEGGTMLIELGEYPFSERYGWVSDRFGVSWQISLAKAEQKIVPFLLFTGAQHGKAEEAMRFYTSLFDDSKIVNVDRYGKDEHEPEGSVRHATFVLQGLQFMAIESAHPHEFGFSEAFSFVVNCESQAEIDRYWEKLTDGGQPLQCGWLKDKFNVTWQIVPPVLIEMMQDKDPSKAKRVTEAMMQMVKLDIAALESAYKG